MALNKFMHPRNKYKKPPDFKSLAIKYPEFRKFAKQEISGKVSLDFKDVNAVRALTCTLLKEDFDLDVEIPLTRLIPTLPLRLNYLLWIEDLLNSNKKQSDDPVRGIDIGCGASCVYPLLAAKHFHWHMLATEVDTDSAFIASTNVKRNKLQDMIKVRTVSEGAVLRQVLEPGTVYDFCMCNPPFFSSEEELDPQHQARGPSRPPPRNAHTGAPWELVAPGGETAFVTKIIQDSVQLKEAVRIYSVMLGHKTSVGRVKQALKEAGVSAKSVATSQFCQGRTTRWGVAWCLQPSVTLAQASPPTPKKKSPFSHACDLDLPNTLEALQTLMEKLQITYTTLKNSKELCAMEICAKTNTWSNSRKKRRQEKLKQEKSKQIEKEECGEKKSVIGDGQETKEQEKNYEINSEIDNDKINDSEKNQTITEANSDEKSGGNKEEIKDTNTESEDPVMNNDKDKEHFGIKRTHGEDAACSTSNPIKRLKTDEHPDQESNGSDKTEPFLSASLVLRSGSPQGTTIEMCWLRGVGGWDSVHQVMQNFKNSLTVSNKPELL